MRIVVLALAVIAATGVERFQRPTPPEAKGMTLEALTWQQAEKLLSPETVVVLPIGAAAKEHGPHLPLRTDLTMAEYLTSRVVAASHVVVAPALPYHFYPAFLEYPGSTTLALPTARGVTVDVVRSLARFGPRRFYALNTGISTVRALEPAAEALAEEGILLHYTNLEAALGPAKARVQEQEGGTHADEIETSMMLYIAPETVNMALAVKDYTPHAGWPLTRQRGGKGTYSPTGSWGDPTLATREKGRILVETLVTGILDDIERLRRAAPPSPRSTSPAPAPPARGGASGAGAEPRVADGKWELRGVTDANGKPLPDYKGQATLVVKRSAGAWRIDAYRYTIEPEAVKPPAFLTRPGWPGKGGA